MPTNAKRIMNTALFFLFITLAFLGGLMITPPGRSYDNAVFNEVFDQLHQNHHRQPSEETLWRGAIDGMIASLEDPYTYYLDGEDYLRWQDRQGEDFVGIGVTVQNVDERVHIIGVFPNSPAEAGGLMAGDVITHVDGVDYRDMSYLETISALSGEEDTDVTIGYERHGVFYETPTLTRRRIDNPSVTADTVQAGIHIIRVHSFGRDTADVFSDELAALETLGIDALIIDVRDNGGGYLSTLEAILDIFLSDDLPYFQSETWWNRESSLESDYLNPTDPKPYPIAVLINGHSASASEAFAAAMHELGDYPLIGTQTFGKGTQQVMRPLRSVRNHFLNLTEGRWMTGAGIWIESNDPPGVSPTHLVEQDPLFTQPLLYVSGETVFSFDMVDDTIARMQALLVMSGYAIRTDGYFDAATQSAVESFQSDTGLSVNGELDAPTAAALSQALLDYRADIANDAQLQAAIDYLEGMLHADD